MGDLSPTIDFTGNSSQADANTQDIQNIMTEMARLANANGINRSVNGTDFYYDAKGINYMQIGILPDSSSGIFIAKPGLNVKDAFS